MPRANVGSQGCLALNQVLQLLSNSGQSGDQLSPVTIKTPTKSAPGSNPVPSEDLGPLGNYMMARQELTIVAAQMHKPWLVWSPNLLRAAYHPEAPLQIG